MIMIEVEVTCPYRGKPISYKIEPGDFQLLVDLLHEYSEKLMLICCELEAIVPQSPLRSRLRNLFSLEHNNPYESWLLECGQRIFSRLKKVMGLILEIEDKVDLNLGRKLELDLRIDETREALERYKSISETLNLRSRIDW